MRLIRAVAALAAASMMVGPALAASANPAASLSLSSNARATGTSKHSSKAVGGTTILLIGLAGAAVIGGAVALGTGHHHDSMPASS